MTGWVTVTKAADLGPGDREVYQVEDYWIAVFNVDGSYYAVEDSCTHDDGPLADGEMDGHEIECPRHGALFDVRTGEALTLPAVQPTRRFEVQVQDDDLQVLLPED